MTRYVASIQNPQIGYEVFVWDRTDCVRPKDERGLPLSWAYKKGSAEQQATAKEKAEAACVVLNSGGTIENAYTFLREPSGGLVVSVSTDVHVTFSAMDLVSLTSRQRSEFVEVLHENLADDVIDYNDITATYRNTTATYAKTKAKATYVAFMESLKS